MTERVAAGEAFAAVVRDAMGEHDLSVSSLAVATGIERGRWYKWFRGESIPRRSTLRRAAAALGVGVDQLADPWGELIEPGSKVADRSEIARLVDVIDRQATAISELAAQVKALIDAQVSPAELATAIGEALAIREALRGGTPAGAPPRL